MCLRDQGIYNDDGVIGRVRRARGISDEGGGVGGGQGIYDASKGSETTPEAAGVRQRVRGIYDNDGGFGGGRLA